MIVAWQPLNRGAHRRRRDGALLILAGLFALGFAARLLPYLLTGALPA